MSIERIFSINPYNENDIKLVEEYEQTNNLKDKLLGSIRKIKDSTSKEDYIEIKKQENEIEENLYIEKDQKIVGRCHIQGEKDIKSCRIMFFTTESILKKRKLISMITEYIINTYGMQEVFTTVNSSDKEMINALRIYGYENLGEENGEILFLKEQEYFEQIQRAI